MIKNIKIENFKSLENINLDLKKLNLLTGLRTCLKSKNLPINFI